MHVLISRVATNRTVRVYNLQTLRREKEIIFKKTQIFLIKRVGEGEAGRQKS